MIVKFVFAPAPLRGFILRLKGFKRGKKAVFVYAEPRVWLALEAHPYDDQPF
jgi:hypothetical protein